MASRKEYEMLINLVAKYSGSSAISKAQRDIAAIGNEITKLTRLQQQVKALGDVRQQLDQLANSGQTNTKEFKQLTTQSNRLTAILNGAGISTQNLAREDENLGNMIYNLRGKQDQLVKAFQEYDAGAQKNTESTEKLEKGLDALVSSKAFEYIAAGAKKVMAAFKECVEVQMEFEATMSKVEALSGATGSEMDSLTKAAKDMGASTVYTAAESGEALSLMALAGWNTQEMLNGLQPILNLAAASEMDMSTATSAVTDNLVAFGLESSDTGHMVDVMAYAMANSNTTTEQLKDAYKGVAATSKSLGVSLEDTTAILMVLANQGIKSSTAGIALNGIFTRLATNTSKCADMLRGYGVEVYDANGNMRNMIDVFSDMSSVWDTLSDKEQAALAKTIAGQRQYNKLQMIMQGLSDDAKESGRSILDFRDALVQSDGAAQDMAETMLNNLQGDVTLLKSAFDGLKIAIGESFNSVLRSATQLLTKIVSGFRDFATEHPKLVRAIGVVTTAIVGVTTALTAFAAAKKLAQSIDLAGLFTALGGFGTIAGVTAGIAGLVALTIELKEANKFDVSSYGELSRGARDASRAVSEAKDELDENLVTVEKNKILAGEYISKLEDLQAEIEHNYKTGVDNTETQKEYRETLSALCQALPEYAGLIDLSTGSIRGGIQALKDHMAAVEEDGKRQAYWTAYNAYIKAHEDALVAAADAQIHMTMSEMEGKAAHTSYEDAAKRATDAQIAYYNAVNEGADNQSELYTEMMRANDELEYYTNEMNAASASTDNASKALGDAEDAAAEAAKEMEIAKQAAAEMGFDFDEAAGAADGVSDASDEVTSSVNSLSAAEAELKDNQFTDALNERIESLTSMIQAYEDSYNAAKKSIEGQYALWDDAKEIIPTSIDEMNRKINEQREYWKQYNDNLDVLSKYSGSVSGLDAMIQSFADGSEDSVNAIAGMAQGIAGLDDNAAEEKLGGMVKSWKKLKDEEDLAAKKIAETTGITESEIANMASEVNQTIMSMDYSYEAAQAASETFSSYYKTAESWTTNIATLISERMGQIQKSLNLSGTFTVNTPNVSSEEAAENYTGTLSAAPGWSMVGEHGPELMQMHGGERVITASQTRALVEHAYSTAGSSDGGYTVSIAPTYNISGGDADAVKTVLDRNNANLKQFIVNTIKDITADKRRRAYA